mmetsp:Transcript_12308/g.39011  ORF Transcript_12308/g.39011 Transcript_12308/m.39011 type:complete len:110 (-) Transcript_12308:165-494(-)
MPGAIAMSPVPSDLFPLVQEFLSENGLSSSLKAFKAETKGKSGANKAGVDLMKLYAAYVKQNPCAPACSPHPPLTSREGGAAPQRRNHIPRVVCARMISRSVDCRAREH